MAKIEEKPPAHPVMRLTVAVIGAVITFIIGFVAGFTYPR
jgi:VIT1/CCC1 family predicted Fe2+/Mn2+ transporter